MQASAIQYLAIADENAVVAAASPEGTVQIWNWRTRQQLGEFKSIMDSGGRRLVLTLDGRICIAGSWTCGLAAYSVPDGQVLWHKRDIREVQEVTLSASGREVYCGVDSNSVHILATETGTPVGKVARAVTIISSPHDSREMTVKEDKYLIQGGSELEIPAASFALHTAAFSPESVCFSEPNAGSRCIDLLTGELLWHHKTIHFSHAAFNASDKRFYCVTGFDTNPYEKSLVRLVVNFAECERVVKLGRRCWTEAFTPSGEFLVVARGDVYETSSGTLLGHLDFPQREYPDSV